MAKAKPKETDITEIKECPDCGSINIKHNEEKQQVICLDCGLIYEPLSPDLEQKFETAHEAAPKTRLEVGELMPTPAPEKPKKAVKRKPKKKARKKAKKAAKKKPAKKKPKKKAKKAAKKKPAKKKPKPAKKQRGLAHRLMKRLTRVKKRKKGSFAF